jgi:site-specific DNA-cytosine methylase
MARPPIIRAFLGDEIIADSFAGGGGASTGIELALGRSPDLAVNHDAEAMAMHRANHPTTEHHIESVWEVDPRIACRGKPVALAWLSPDCKHHSKALGGKPREHKLRGLAAQGFADEYRIDPEHNGKPLTKTAQIRMCGNSVCPPIAAAIVRALFPEAG